MLFHSHSNHHISVHPLGNLLLLEFLSLPKDSLVLPLAGPLYSSLALLFKTFWFDASYRCTQISLRYIWLLPQQPLYGHHNLSTTSCIKATCPYGSTCCRPYGSRLYTLLQNICLKHHIYYCCKQPAWKIIFTTACHPWMQDYGRNWKQSPCSGRSKVKS